MAQQWRYACEDELEAHGLILLLERQSIEVTRVRDGDGSIVLVCEGPYAKLAEAFETKLLSRNAKALRQEHHATWISRDERRDRRLAMLGGFGLLALAFMMLRACL